MITPEQAKFVLHALGFHQRQVGEEMGYSRASVARWLGSKEPMPEVFENWLEDTTDAIALRNSRGLLSFAQSTPHPAKMKKDTIIFYPQHWVDTPENRAFYSACVALGLKVVFA